MGATKKIKQKHWGESVIILQPIRRVILLNDKTTKEDIALLEQTGNNAYITTTSTPA